MTPTKTTIKNAWNAALACKIPVQFCATHDLNGRRDGAKSVASNIDGENNDETNEGARLEDVPECAGDLAFVLLDRTPHYNVPPKTE